MTLSRVLEPELMDDPAQARAYAEADFAASDRAMLERLLKLFGCGGLGAAVVDLGCGPGNLTFPLADACPSLSVLGIDGADAMLAIAAERLRQRNERRQRLQFHRAVLPLSETEAAALRSAALRSAALRSAAVRSAGGAGFSAVVSNSLLHHLHDPAVLWRTVLQLGVPGAALYLRDLRRPPDAAGLEALVERHAAGAPPLLRRDYRHSLQAAFSVEEVEKQLDQAGLGGLTVQPQADRYLEVWGRLPPASS